MLAAGLLRIVDHDGYPGSWDGCRWWLIIMLNKDGCSSWLIRMAAYNDGDFIISSQPSWYLLIHKWWWLSILLIMWHPVDDVDRRSRSVCPKKHHPHNQAFGSADPSWSLCHLGLMLHHQESTSHTVSCALHVDWAQDTIITPSTWAS